LFKIKFIINNERFCPIQDRSPLPPSPNLAIIPQTKKTTNVGLLIKYYTFSLYQTIYGMVDTPLNADTIGIWFK
jgi:hypothetical protein